jgi:ABC-type multidrug transport system fused ATPase/permease subunit
MIFIVFIGPQGAGKSTLARLLMKKLTHEGFTTRIVKLIDYTIFHRTYLKVLISLTKNTDLSRVFSKLFPLFIFLHFAGSLISAVKIILSKLMWKCNVIIEDEGFIFKEIADIYFTAYITDSLKTKINQRTAKLLLIFLLTIGRKVVGRHVITIYVNAPYDTLKVRYSKYKRRMEDKRYIIFQNYIYNKLMDNTMRESEYQKLYFENTNIASIPNIIKHVIKMIKGI